jgi:hypothetical protein
MKNYYAHTKQIIAFTTITKRNIKKWRITIQYAINIIYALIIWKNRWKKPFKCLKLSQNKFPGGFTPRKKNGCILWIFSSFFFASVRSYIHKKSTMFMPKRNKENWKSSWNFNGAISYRRVFIFSRSLYFYFLKKPTSNFY